MSRVEQVGKLMELISKKTKEKPEGTFEEMTVWHLGTIGTILADISVSLAVIADSMSKKDGEYCSEKCAKRDLSTFRLNEPMQVELEGDGYADGELVYDFGKCPNCGWEFEEGDKDWEEPYCCHCGQKLHWFETQEMKDES